MKSKVKDTRKFALTTLATVIGVALFILFLPSIGESSVYSYILLNGLLWLMPLFIIAIILLIIANKKHSFKLYKKELHKHLADSIMLGILLSIVFNLLSYSLPRFESGTLSYFYVNLSSFLIYISGILLLILNIRQNFVYWPFWNKTDRSSADERQLAVRNRVFERSYRVTLIIITIALWLNFTNISWGPRLLVLAGLSILAAPAIIATRQKDS